MSAPLKRILQDITRLEGVRGALVVSKDGLVVDAVVPRRDIDAEDLGATASQAVALISKVGDHFELGKLFIASLEYANGLLVMGDLGDHILLVVADKDALIGAIRNEIKRQADKVKALVG